MSMESLCSTVSNIPSEDDFLSMAPEARALTAVLDHKSTPPIASQEYAIMNVLKTLHKESSDGKPLRHISLVSDEMYPSFPLVDFLNVHQIKFQVLDEPRHEMISWSSMPINTIPFFPPKVDGDSWAAERSKPGLKTQLHAGVLRFTFKGTDFTVYKVVWHKPRHGSEMQCSLYDIVFEGPSDEWSSTESAGHRLAEEIYLWAGDNRDGIWVFQGGHWNKNRELRNAIQQASWQDIFLDKEFLTNLRRDVRSFFDNQKIYDNLGTSWKRGILLVGPPGNGKTETIKVLLKEAKQNALYVKSFTSADGQELGVKAIFDFARSNAPCILVIEDLDSLVTGGVRSFFLNELDGLGRNDGILTIATTNHPEQIDDAILNRPSRFDVKYNFALPSLALRSVYSLRWVRKVGQTSLENTPMIEFARSEMEMAEEIARRTDGWSFAFLKELFMSFLLRVAHDQSVNESGKLQEFWDETLFDHLKMLSLQISQTFAQNSGFSEQRTIDSSVKVGIKQTQLEMKESGARPSDARSFFDFSSIFATSQGVSAFGVCFLILLDVLILFLYNNLTK